MKVFRLVHSQALRRSTPFRPTPTDNRWNTDMTTIAYASESIALAAWEILTYWAYYDSLEGYLMFSFELSVDEIETLETGAIAGIADRRVTQMHGDTWALEQRSLALRVPSLRLPVSYNYLINPNHKDFTEDRIQELGPLVLDEKIRELLAAARKS